MQVMLIAESIKFRKKNRPDADGILPEVFLFTFHRNYRNSLRKRCGVIP